MSDFWDKFCSVSPRITVVFFFFNAFFGVLRLVFVFYFLFSLICFGRFFVSFLVLNSWPPGLLFCFFLFFLFFRFD